VSATDTDFNFAIFFPDKANGGKLKDATRAYMNRAEAVGAQSVYLKQGDALPAFDATMYVLVPAPQ